MAGLLAFLLGGAGFVANGQDAPAVSLRIREPWCNVFGGRAATFNVEVAARNGFDGRLGWRLAADGRTLDRGEAAVRVGAGASQAVEIPLRIPDVKPGVVMDASLEVAVGPAGAGDGGASAARRLWVFPDDPFADRRDWLKGLSIRLFDPAGKTAEVFRQANVPAEFVDRVDALAGAGTNLIVVGEGVSFEEYRGLAEVLTRAAAAGARVLCLAPANGRFAMPGMGGADLPVPRSVAFRQHDVIRELDKRLDAEAWSPDGKVAACRLNPVGDRGPVVCEVTVDGPGWPWVDIAFDGGGRLLVCGFAVIGKWDAGPTPRFLFAKMLEEVVAAAPGSHSQEAHDEGR